MKIAQLTGSMDICDATVQAAGTRPAAAARIWRQTTAACRDDGSGPAGERRPADMAHFSAGSRPQRGIPARPLQGHGRTGAPAPVREGAHPPWDRVTASAVQQAAAVPQTGSTSGCWCSTSATNLRGRSRRPVVLLLRPAAAHLERLPTHSIGEACCAVGRRMRMCMVSLWQPRWRPLDGAQLTPCSMTSWTSAPTAGQRATGSRLMSRMPPLTAPTQPVPAVTATSGRLTLARQVTRNMGRLLKSKVAAKE